MGTRQYQEDAIANVRRAWNGGAETVLLVAPTGSGKTEMGARLIGESRTLWVAHRRELVTQAAERLRLSLGTPNVGVVMAGEPETPSAKVQVASIQTLLSRNLGMRADTIVLDEAHHYMADEWRALTDASGGRRCVGLTASPERDDGRALGDIFRTLIVAAQYSELIREGFIVPARVLRPERCLGSDLAQDPVEAYMRYGEQSRAFIFAQRVEKAYAIARALRLRRVSAKTVEAETAHGEREDLLRRFRHGKLMALVNVATLNEGVDAPDARCVVLGKSFGHAGAMIQACGRALRSSPGKKDAIILDLTGCTYRLGMPDADREYSLEGRAIAVADPREYVERSEPTQDVLGLELVIGARGALPPDATLPPPLAAIDLSDVAEATKRDNALERFDLRPGKRRRRGARADDIAREMIESHYRLPRIVA